jgi:hypothetical protein
MISYRKENNPELIQAANAAYAEAPPANTGHWSGFARDLRRGVAATPAGPAADVPRGDDALVHIVR